MKSPKPPAPPDPQETGAAQTTTNVQTAIANAQLGNVDTYTPEGSITYAQDPNQTIQIADQEGNLHDIPKYTSTTTYSPEQQSLYDQATSNELGLGRFAGSQINFLDDYLGRPFDGTNEATEARIMELGERRLEPALARQEDRLRTRLANQGLSPDDAAYKSAMETQNQSANDAYTQLLMNARGQAFGEALQSRNQPISELTQLIYGSQPQAPQQAAFNPAQSPTVDYAGLVNDNYNQRLNIWNQQQAQRAGLFGSILGGFGSVLGAFSDERLKKDKKKVGNIKGHDIYEYRFKGQDKDEPKTLGVMAQEVEKQRPDAVTRDPETGFKRVKYGQLFGAH